MDEQERIAAQMYTNNQLRRAKNTELRGQQENLKDLLLADDITSHVGSRINPEAWDRMLREGPESQNFEDRREDPPLSSEDARILQQEAEMRDRLGLNLPMATDPSDRNNPMSKALGVDDLDRIIEEQLQQRMRQQRNNI